MSSSFFPHAGEPASAARNDAFPFLQLPPEIRNRVYWFIIQQRPSVLSLWEYTTIGLIKSELGRFDSMGEQYRPPNRGVVCRTALAGLSHRPTLIPYGPRRKCTNPVYEDMEEELDDLAISHARLRVGATREQQQSLMRVPELKHEYLHELSRCFLSNCIVAVDVNDATLHTSLRHASRRVAQVQERVDHLFVSVREGALRPAPPPALDTADEEFRSVAEFVYRTACRARQLSHLTLYFDLIPQPEIPDGIAREMDQLRAMAAPLHERGIGYVNALAARINHYSSQPSAPTLQRPLHGLTVVWTTRLTRRLPTIFNYSLLNDDDPPSPMVMCESRFTWSEEGGVMSWKLDGEPHLVQVLSSYSPGNVEPIASVV